MALRTIWWWPVLHEERAPALCTHTQQLPQISKSMQPDSIVSDSAQETRTDLSTQKVKQLEKTQREVMALMTSKADEDAVRPGGPTYTQLLSLEILWSQPPPPTSQGFRSVQFRFLIWQTTESFNLRAGRGPRNYLVQSPHWSDNICLIYFSNFL